MYSCEGSVNKWMKPFFHWHDSLAVRHVAAVLCHPLRRPRIQVQTVKVAERLTQLLGRYRSAPAEKIPPAANDGQGAVTKIGEGKACGLIGCASKPKGIGSPALAPREKETGGAKPHTRCLKVWHGRSPLGIAWVRYALDCR
jgi:hypothetical protein